MGKVTFKLVVLNAQKIIYAQDATSACFTGDETEFEVLPFHSPLLAVLKRGSIIVDRKYEIIIEKGLVKFFENECMVIAEEPKLKEDLEFQAEEISD